MNISQSSKQSSRPVFLVIGAVAVITLLWYAFKPSALPVVSKAVVVLKGDSGVGGSVIFQQESLGGKVTITGDLQGLKPNFKQGFHIHVSGDLSNGCLSAGSHFNPYNKNHGAPSDSTRHVGDLGNVESDEFGNAKFTIEDKLVSLNGPSSVVGRSVVLHAGTDDLGKGGDDESLKTGNAGARAACGVIGLA
ncbi:Superoxide dismutase [Cu-Zn] [Abortiporus biennis]